MFSALHIRMSLSHLTHLMPFSFLYGIAKNISGISGKPAHVERSLAVTSLNAPSVGNLQASQIQHIIRTRGAGYNRDPWFWSRHTLTAHDHFRFAALHDLRQRVALLRPGRAGERAGEGPCGAGSRVAF